jgi:cell division topological specificity factor
MFTKLFQLLGLTRAEDAITPVSSAKDISGRSSAYNRLRLVLMHDRTQLEPHTLEAMRDDLVEVISKYIEVDRSAIELNLETDPETNQVALMANIPVSGARDQSTLHTTANTVVGASASTSSASVSL